MAVRDSQARAATWEQQRLWMRDALVWPDLTDAAEEVTPALA
jgi:hypothetical protein